MRHVLDTSVFFEPDALAKLVSLPDPIVLPTVAFTERVRQLLAAGRDIDAFRASLARNRIRVEPYSEAEAMQAAARSADAALWKRHARDAMIAGHVGEGDRLWTANARDFRALGLADEQIVDLRRHP